MTALTLTHGAPEQESATHRANARALSLAVVASALQLRIYTDLGEAEQAAQALADTRKALAAVEPHVLDAARMATARRAHTVHTQHLAQRARRAERIAQIEADPGAFDPRLSPGRPPNLGPWL